MTIISLLIALNLAIFTLERASAHHNRFHWKPSVVWMRQALCVHRHEGSWRDPDAPYYGGMQFHIDTWRRAGGKGYPHHASVREQLYRAWRIWRMNGGRWNEWPTFARYCQ